MCSMETEDSARGQVWEGEIWCPRNKHRKTMEYLQRVGNREQQWPRRGVSHLLGPRLVRTAGTDDDTRATYSVGRSRLDLPMNDECCLFSALLFSTTLPPGLYPTTAGSRQRPYLVAGGGAISACQQW